MAAFGTIYKIQAPNGKVYIGQNAMRVNANLKVKHGHVKLSLNVYGLTRRCYDHCKPSSGCTILKRSIAKYGWDSMKVEVLLHCREEHLDFYECLMMKAWDALAPHGLNCIAGGQGGNREAGMCPETRQNIAMGLRSMYRDMSEDDRKSFFRNRPGSNLTPSGRELKRPPGLRYVVVSATTPIRMHGRRRSYSQARHKEAR
jgi:hypothetical protein